MPRKTISMSLGGSSIRAALKELASYQAWVRQKTSELTERLASIGAYEATVRFSRAQYDGEKQAEVSVEPIKNGWKIAASGGSLFFIEFGAGVFFNGPEPYPEPRPDRRIWTGQGKAKYLGLLRRWRQFDFNSRHSGGDAYVSRRAHDGTGD